MNGNDTGSGNNPEVNAEGIFVDESYMKAHQKQLDIKNQRKMFQNQAFKFFEYCKSIAIVLLALGVFVFLILWGLSLFNEKEIQVVTPNITLPSIPQQPTSSSLYCEPEDDPRTTAPGSIHNGYAIADLEKIPSEPHLPEASENPEAPPAKYVPESSNIPESSKIPESPPDEASNDNEVMKGRGLKPVPTASPDVRPTIQEPKESNIEQTVVIFERVKNIKGEDIETGFEYEPPWSGGGRHGLGDVSDTWCYSEYWVDGLRTRIDYWSSFGVENQYVDRFSNRLTKEEFNTNKLLCENKK